MKLSVVAFEPEAGNDLEEQLSNCLEQIHTYTDKRNGKEHPISVNFFIPACSNEEYDQQKEILKKQLSGKFLKYIPLAILAQPPASGSLISAEVYMVRDNENLRVNLKRFEDHPYMVLSYGASSLLIANGIGQSCENKTIAEASEEVFSRMNGILQAENMSFGNIFRQWNYIEQITANSLGGEERVQHYQQFNNVRTLYYSNAEFSRGYPAATGIGIYAGGVIVGFFAASDSGPQLSSIENSLQTAAFEYSDEVLVGDANYKGVCKCTPKFARAKAIRIARSTEIFISGTASIRGEHTVGEGDVSRQTEVTINNMLNLLSKDTLDGIQYIEASPEIKFIRVYIKNTADYPAVKKVCEQKLPGINAVYVLSDVCRESLLVEIEALAS